MVPEVLVDRVKVRVVDKARDKETALRLLQLPVGRRRGKARVKDKGKDKSRRKVNANSARK